MDDVLRLGVFQRGDAWTLTGDDGLVVAFPTREEAMEAAKAMGALHRALGAKVEVVAQNDLSELTTVISLPPPST